MFGKRQILIGLCSVMLSGSVIASDNSSALHGQGSSMTRVPPVANFGNIQPTYGIQEPIMQDDWGLRFRYLQDIGSQINSHLSSVTLIERENAVYAAIKAAQAGVGIGEMDVSNIFTNMAGIPNNKDTEQWTPEDKVKFCIYHISLAYYYSNPAWMLSTLYGIRRLRNSFNSLQLQGQITLDDRITEEETEEETEASSDQE